MRLSALNVTEYSVAFTAERKGVQKIYTWHWDAKRIPPLPGAMVVSTQIEAIFEAGQKYGRLQFEAETAGEPVTRAPRRLPDVQQSPQPKPASDNWGHGLAGALIARTTHAKSRA